MLSRCFILTCRKSKITHSEWDWEADKPNLSPFYIMHFQLEKYNALCILKTGWLPPW